LAYAAFRGMLEIKPERLARIEDAHLAWPVLGFAVVVSMMATLLFALAPAFQSFRIDHMDSLRTRGFSWIGRRHGRAGRALVTTEIALGFVLVAGTALAARTLSKIEQVRPGFDAGRVLAFQLPGMPPDLVYEWTERFARIPGVESVGAISHLPFD